jgi:hypothetical protein
MHRTLLVHTLEQVLAAAAEDRPVARKEADCKRAAVERKLGLEEVAALEHKGSHC